MTTTTEREIILARVRAFPDNAVISVGLSPRELSKDDIINEIENKTEIGEEFIKMQMFYIRSFKNQMI